MRFSVVIPTYNRRHLVGRAIESVLQQNWPEMDVIVVDNASTDGTGEYVQQTFPQVRYLRQEVNGGPGPARQRGISEARNPWVIPLDDDDALAPNGLAMMTEAITGWPPASEYPIIVFTHGNGALVGDFRVMRLADYLCGNCRGDLLPVIQRELFLARGLRYPDTRLGAEHILIWKVAYEQGIPAWSRPVAFVGHESPTRLTHTGIQIREAAEHARLQELTIELFHDALVGQFDYELLKRHMGAAVYWLLAGERRRAREHVLFLQDNGRGGQAAALRAYALLPGPLRRWAFSFYRRMTR